MAVASASRACQSRVPARAVQRCPLALPRLAVRQSRRSATRHVPSLSRGALTCWASSAAAQPSGSTPKRHAFLHDFCMCIPFGAASVLGGIAFFFLNLTNIAATAVIAGATSLVASFLSLQEWKQSGDSTVYTLTSAASAAFVTYTAVQALPAIKGALPYGLAVALAALAAAAAAFCLYNVAAGGNPPPKGEKKK